MKKLLIIRHAKSSWEIETQNDFERPLNDKGNKDGIVMAQRIFNKKIHIDAFVSSPAKRAKKTAELFCPIFNRKKEDIILIPQLYHATAEIFFEVVEQLGDEFNTVAIFSHNPGITEFVNELTEDIIINNMPTCSVLAVKIAVGKWKDFALAKKELLFFDCPSIV